MLSGGRVFSLETNSLTWAEAVAADGPFGVVWAHVTLLALLLGERWIWQRGPFVLWPERMEDQTWDAAAGASFFRRLPLLFKTAYQSDPHRTTAQILSTLWQVEKCLHLVLCISFQATDSTCKNQCRKTHLIFLERSHCASQRVFFPWRVKKRRKSQVESFIYRCGCLRGAASMWRSDSWYTRALCLNSDAF